MHKTPPDPSAPSTSKYSIGVVARLAQVPIETVRMWERRYEILAPGRTDGGHRLYSDDDVLLLRAAKSLVDSGLRPGDVFRLGRERLLQEAQRAQLPAPTPADAADGAAAIDAVVDAARSLDQTRVAALLDGPLVNRAVFDVVEGLWLPVLVRVGALWEEGEVSVAVEHFLTQLVNARLQSALRSTTPAQGPVVLCACVPEERHEIGLLASALALKRGGFVPVVLGSDVPAEDLAVSAVTARADVLVLSATMSLSKKAKKVLPVLLEQAPLASLPLLIGGASAGALSARLTRSHTVVPAVADVVARARSALSA